MSTQVTTPKLYGVDISHANADPINLHELVAAGSLSFIGLKATEGHDFIDPTFVDRFKRIAQNLPNVYVLAYHFLRIDSSPGDQMRHFHDVLTRVGYFDQQKTLAPAIDAERGLQGQEPTASNVTASIDTLRSLSGGRVGVYTGQAYWQEQLSTVKPDWRWIARYSSSVPVVAYDIWQDSESRVIAGKAYDHNVFYGTVKQLTAKCGRA